MPDELRPIAAVARPIEAAAVTDVAKPRRCRLRAPPPTPPPSAAPDARSTPQYAAVAADTTLHRRRRRL
jgi:hypothetical protein